MRSLLLFVILAITLCFTFAAPVVTKSSNSTGQYLPVKVIDERTLLRIPFSLSNPQDKEIFDVLIADPQLRIFRENQARIRYQMALDEYDRLYAKHVKTLYSLADAFDYKFSPYALSYRQLLKIIRNKAKSQQDSIAKVGGFTFLQVNQQLAELEANQNLFEDRYTVHDTALIEDALLHGVAGIMDKIMGKIRGILSMNKCDWCKAVSKLMKKGLCSAAGKGICTLLINSIANVIPGAGIIASKYICGIPFFLGSVFGGWCTSAVNMLEKKFNVNDKCYCSLKIPDIKIPEINISIIRYKSPARVISLGGGICAPDPSCPQWMKNNHNNNGKKK